MIKNRKIGIFDSGLGGLIILKSIRSVLPNYDYVYFGDTKHMPYGNKTQYEIRQLTINGVEFLFKQNCSIVIIACNTASAKALGFMQQKWLPKNYPDRKILGVIIPTVEIVAFNKKIRRIGVLATKSTVRSNVYKKELEKLNPNMQLFQLSAPLLVPAIESGNFKIARVYLKKYIAYFITKKVEAIILGCTHYPLLKLEIKILAGNTIIVSQDEIISKALSKYLNKHNEIKRHLSTNKTVILFTSKIFQYTKIISERWFASATLFLRPK